MVRPEIFQIHLFVSGCGGVWAGFVWPARRRRLVQQKVERDEQKPLFEKKPVFLLIFGPSLKHHWRVQSTVGHF